jgi:two-component system, LytTR family, sensor kinase
MLEKQRAVRLGVLLRLALLYSGVALVAGCYDYLLGSQRGYRAPWFIYIYQRFPQWIVWTAWTPIVVWMGDRFRLDQGRRIRNALVHLAVLAAMAPLVVASDLLLLELMTLPGAKRSFAEKFFENFREPYSYLLAWLLVASLTYAMVLAISYGLRYRKESHERQLEESRLQTALARAELQTLKNQLHPHFLFNALNAVSTLITKDPTAAKRTVLQLAGLLRRLLADSETQEVPLAEEIAFARSYLEIEQVRFSNRLTVEISVDPQVAKSLVPHLLLQPLVENAVRHGIGPKEAPGAIRIEVALAGEKVLLTVLDDGVGRSRSPRKSDGAGVGLVNLRARLKRLYGDAAGLECGDRPEGGFAARVALPMRRAGAGESRPDPGGKPS